MSKNSYALMYFHVDRPASLNRGRYFVGYVVVCTAPNNR